MKKEIIIVYGIPNCDTTKKALAWFEKKKTPVQFHDYKVKSISPEKLSSWIEEKGLDSILNKRSTTWRSLPPAQQQKITGVVPAIKLMVENTSLIKRPVIESGDAVYVGYDETAWEKLVPF